MSQTCTETRKSVIEIDASERPSAPLRSAALLFYLALWESLRRLIGCLGVLLLDSARLFATRLVQHDGKGSTHNLLESSLRVAARQEACRRRCQPHVPRPGPLLSSQLAPRDKMTVSVFTAHRNTAQRDNTALIRAVARFELPKANICLQTGRNNDWCSGCS